MQDVGSDNPVHAAAILDHRRSRGRKASPACFRGRRNPSVLGLHDVNPVSVPAQEEA